MIEGICRYPTVGSMTSIALHAYTGIKMARGWLRGRGTVSDMTIHATARGIRAMNPDRAFKGSCCMARDTI